MYTAQTVIWHLLLKPTFFGKGADINGPDIDGNPILLSKLLLKDYQIAEWLISIGADLNAKDKHGIPQLIQAYKTNIEIADWLISMGADVDAKDMEGRPLLYYSLLFLNIDIAEWLISRGAYLDARGDYGNGAPLYVALLNNNKELLELLMANGSAISTASCTSKQERISRVRRVIGMR
jgi:ankyrin repeat protein